MFITASKDNSAKVRERGSVGGREGRGSVGGRVEGAWEGG